MFHRRPGNFNASFECAKRCSAIAATVDDPAAITLAHCVLGTSQHTSAFFAEARSELEAALSGGYRSEQTTTVYLGIEGTILAAAILARNLWLQGYPDQAAEWALQAVEEARNMDHSLTLAGTLLWGITVAMWNGDLQKVGKDTDQLMALSEPHSLDPYIFVGRGFKGDLAIRQGNANAGVEALQSALQKLHALPYLAVLTELRLALAQGLSALRRFDESLDSINDTIKLIEVNGDFMYMPEALRVKGGILLSMAREGDAEHCFVRSLALARRQGALAWELRTTTDLAKLVASQGQSEKAHELLLPVFQQFTEGFDTTDLMAARRFLDAFRPL